MSNQRHNTLLKEVEQLGNRLGISDALSLLVELVSVPQEEGEKKEKKEKKDR